MTYTAYVSYTTGNAPNRVGRGMVRRTYYLPSDVVAELDRAVVGAQASAYVERAPDKSAVVAAVIRAGLTALPEVVDELRTTVSSRVTAPARVGATTQTTRWQRPVVVAENLGELRGPLEGSVQLPIEVHSSGAGPTESFDLADPAMRAALYQLLLRQGRLVDLRQYVNGDELRRLWPQLWLPTYVRRAWVKHFPNRAA